MRIKSNFTSGFSSALSSPFYTLNPHETRKMMITHLILVFCYLIVIILRLMPYKKGYSLNNNLKLTHIEALKIITITSKHFLFGLVLFLFFNNKTKRLWTAKMCLLVWPSTVQTTENVISYFEHSLSYCVSQCQPERLLLLMSDVNALKFELN